MLTQTQNIYDIALTLPPIERIELIKRFYFSLDLPASRKYIDELWLEEIENRISAFEQGESGLAKHIGNGISGKNNLETELIAMANDPDIQRELKMIEAEFAITEADGLEGV